MECVNVGRGCVWCVNVCLFYWILNVYRSIVGCRVCAELIAHWQRTGAVFLLSATKITDEICLKVENLLKLMNEHYFLRNSDILRGKCDSDCNWVGNFEILNFWIFEIYVNLFWYSVKMDIFNFESCFHEFIQNSHFQNEFLRLFSK